MPLMSVIVITPDNLGTVARTIAHVRAQAARRDLELVLVGPGVAAQATVSGLASDFAAVRTVDIEDMRSTARARAAGIRAATAPVVVLTEDHSFPALSVAALSPRRRCWR